MKRLTLLLLVLISLSSFASGTHAITGAVYDAKDKLPIAGATVKVAGTTIGMATDAKGEFKLDVPETGILQVSFIGYVSQNIQLSSRSKYRVYLQADTKSLSEVVVVGYGVSRKRDVTYAAASVTSAPQALSGKVAGVQTLSATSRIQVRGVSSANGYMAPIPQADVNDESYKGVTENGFKNPTEEPLSTFSIDVDGASYTNIRRFINNGQLPPTDAVRVEEMINYFSYNLPAPKDNSPIAIHTELSSAPWNPQHRLLRIGLKAKQVNTDKLPASNLVFLIDVSGSMWSPNKLPLVQSSLKMLVDQLRPQDHVAMVVYAGAAGLVLPSTPGDQKTTIKEAIDKLVAGGSTAGGAGIKLAYQVAQQNFIKNGNNRVILATDGDFNVGASSDEDMEHLIERERKSGVFLSVLGYGMGNYKDSKMETLADKGNGNYAYIDNLTEARKTLVSEFGGTLFTVAKDVKLQIEFNPAKVQAYRLIGYENRLLNKEDFNNDLKDAGDMGVGHTVTAFYEIIPAGVEDSFSPTVDPLKYQKPDKNKNTYTGNEMMTIKFRYKEPSSDRSQLKQTTVADAPVALANTSDDFRFAAAVAEFGMLLRESDYRQQASYDQAIELARKAKGEDREGYRAEMVKLAETAKLMAKSGLASTNK
ncbi:von Willebrand factor type A domain-containing protein [Mucilaginibacter sp. RS28]|uniref:von Willebrand factor type A domain-containing protein n=1 Tax=Mucilaginibacter straminoryzae TaxID=2932774 RepID=A0A9X2BDM4_9SPHI|nr:VWA domain-containing protein [Mucilaginibacter straminoryzae]MCJ8210483.1 von Willebrand factor type A domain-containing protein [Mucilaginibacter straminoryzae]